MNRRYYSRRTGISANSSKIDLAICARLFCDIFRDFERKYFFQEAFGYECIDAGIVPGNLGFDIEAQLFRVLRKPFLWPITQYANRYSEDDLFDMIEFLYDHISKPIKGWLHDFGGCGWHYEEFDSAAGKEEFRAEINSFLQDYGDGFELSPNGEILILPSSGLDELLAKELPQYDPENVEQRVSIAKNKFLTSRSSLETRGDAVKDLAAVLEFLRPKLKVILTKNDESDLFNIANNFGIRHHNESQKTQYDKSIWYSWMFHYYLATIHAALRLLEKSKG